MKKHIITLMAGAMLALTASNAEAQMTLQQTIANGNCNNFVIENNPNNAPLQVVNLLLNGKKYVLQDMIDNQVRIYNLDYSLWKTINLPPITGSSPASAYYISENLFKLDGKVDMAVLYGGSGSGTTGNTNLIIDETGAIINTIDSSDAIVVYNTGTDSFVAVTGVYPNGVNNAGNVMKIYSLPGTVPCSSCTSTSLGMGRVANGNSDGSLSNAVPNPTSGNVRISYSLPVGISNGTIMLTNQLGQKMQTYKVTSNTPYIIISTTGLATGIYYYTLTAIGMNPITKELVVN